MATCVFFETFALDVLNKVHNFDADTFMLALCAAANAPDAAADGQLSDLTEIAYTNLVGRTVTVSSVAQVGGVATVIVDDFTLEASGGAVATFRYIVLYNDTATNDELVCYYDVGSNVTLADTQELILDFNGVSGVLQFAPA